MQVRQHTNKIEMQYRPTDLQKALGEPLRSEQRTGELLPRVLSRVDMLAIFIVIVLFIPNASIVQATEGAGSNTYLYWYHLNFWGRETPLMWLKRCCSNKDGMLRGKEEAKPQRHM